MGLSREPLRKSQSTPNPDLTIIYIWINGFVYRLLDNFIIAKTACQVVRLEPGRSARQRCASICPLAPMRQEDDPVLSRGVMPVLVTGASGFIGAHVVCQLSKGDLKLERC